MKQTIIVVISGSEFKATLEKVLENGQYTFKMLEDTYNKGGYSVFKKGQIVKMKIPEYY